MLLLLGCHKNLHWRMLQTLMRNSEAHNRQQNHKHLSLQTQTRILVVGSKKMATKAALVVKKLKSL